jgi:hypothetical protein
MSAASERRAKILADHTEQRRYNFVRIWKRRYAHMTARAEGRSTNRSNAVGKELMTQEEFLAWCKQYDNLMMFVTLYMEWAENEFPLHLAPSVDRIESERGYVADNIQWLSFADNCEKNNRDPFTYKEMKV